MTKICCISDTHGYHKNLTIPKCDVLVHAGDFSSGRGSLEQIRKFNEWLGTLDAKHIVLIAGNHDFPLQDKAEEAEAILTNCTYLRDSSVVIDGIKFYGAPWQPWFHSWAFNVTRGAALADIWAKIPEDTDVLITHGPPHGIMDRTEYEGIRVGCEELRKRIDVVRPSVSVFGHLHEEYGELSQDGTRFINASSCNLKYQPVNQPIVIDF